MIYIAGFQAQGYKNHPRERLCCITAVRRIKFAKFEYSAG